MGWEIRSTQSGRLAVCSALEDAGAPHAVTTQDQGSLAWDGGPSVVAQRKAVCRALGMPLEALTQGRQVHGAGVATVGSAERGRGGARPDDALPDTDALVTAEPGILLCVTAADCLPVFLVDTASGVAALMHAGWRGIAAEVVPRAMQQFRASGGSPMRAVAAIGPGICPRCFEVGPDVCQAFSQLGLDAALEASGGRWRADLRRAVLAQLEWCGIPGRAVSVAPWCTACHATLFFSHRREGAAAGRQAAVLAAPDGS